MVLFVHTLDRTIHAASNGGTWQVPPGFELVILPGDSETFPWPNGAPNRYKLDGANQVIPDPKWDAATLAPSKSAILADLQVANTIAEIRQVLVKVIRHLG